MSTYQFQFTVDMKSDEAAKDLRDHLLDIINSRIEGWHPNVNAPESTIKLADLIAICRIEKKAVL